MTTHKAGTLETIENVRRFTAQSRGFQSGQTLATSSSRYKSPHWEPSLLPSYALIQEALQRKLLTKSGRHPSRLRLLTPIPQQDSVTWGEVAPRIGLGTHFLCDSSAVCCLPWCAIGNKFLYSPIPLPSAQDSFQDHLWVPETIENTEPH